MFPEDVSYGIWQISKHGTAEKIASFPDRPDQHDASIGWKLKSPQHGFVLIGLSRSGEETSELFIVDVLNRRVLETGLRRVSGQPIFYGNAATFIFLQADELNRPCRVRHVAIDEDASLVATTIYEDDDPRFFYRLVLWADRCGANAVGKSVSNSRIISFDFRDAGLSPRKLSWDIPCNFPSLTMSTADANAVYVGHSRINGTEIWARSALVDMDDMTFFWSDAERRHLHAMGLSPTHLLLVLNKGNRFYLAAVDRVTGSTVNALIPGHMPHCQFSILDIRADGNVRVMGQSIVDAPMPYMWDPASGSFKPYNVEKALPAPNVPTHETLLLTFIASDGVEVPITFVASRAIIACGKSRSPCPAVGYAYGSYGRTLLPDYSSSRLLLMSDDIGYFMVHVRGGGEFGPAWHHAGRKDHKLRSALDFIEAIDWLIRERYILSGRVAATARSAGSALIALAANLRPDLLCAIAFESPFLDVAGSMSDTSLPLTLAEQEEWGNAQHADDWNNLKNICPVATASPQKYPDVMVFCGQNDWRAPLKQVAAWVETLRDLRVERNLMLAYIDDHGGHSLKKTARRSAEWIYFLRSRLLRRDGA
jgi:protease II